MVLLLSRVSFFGVVWPAMMVHAAGSELLRERRAMDAMDKDRHWDEALETNIVFGMML